MRTCIKCQWPLILNSTQGKDEYICYNSECSECGKKTGEYKGETLNARSKFNDEINSIPPEETRTLEITKGDTTKC